MTWLPLSVLATLIYTIILTLTFLYLYWTQQKKHLAFFCISWCLYSFRFVFMLLSFYSNTSLFLILNQATVLLSGYILIYAFQLWTGKKLLSLPLTVITLALLLWLPAAALFTLPLSIVSLPIFFYVGFLYIGAGIILLRSSIHRSLGRNVLSVTLIIWGLHKMDYPFLRPIEALAPWGYLLGAVAAIITGLATVLIYLTDTQTQLQKSLGEREVLIKEIQHRVKNNLAILHSLIRFQATSHTEEPEIQEIFTRLENKVFTFALIQEHLYQSETLNTLNLRDYLIQLAQYVVESFGESPAILEIQYKASRTSTSADFGKSLGLIITEAITNSIKYAFPSSCTHKKRINLTIQETTDQRWLVDISDNGIGLPPEWDKGTPKMSGLFLIKMLTEDLGGHVSISHKEGVHIAMDFPFPDTGEDCP